MYQPRTQALSYEIPWVRGCKCICLIKSKEILSCARANKNCQRKFARVDEADQLVILLMCIVSLYVREVYLIMRNVATATSI